MSMRHAWARALRIVFLNVENIFRQNNQPAARCVPHQFNLTVRIQDYGRPPGRCGNRFSRLRHHYRTDLEAPFTSINASCSLETLPIMA
jgi:hypothetical protein